MAELGGIVLLGIGSLVFGIAIAHSNHNARANRKDTLMKQLSKKARRALVRYTWPEAAELSAADGECTEAGHEHASGPRVRKRDRVIRVGTNLGHRLGEAIVPGSEAHTAQTVELTGDSIVVDGFLSFEGSECPICLETHQPGDQMLFLLCKHTLHEHCVRPWLDSGHSSCPVCKRDLEALTEEHSAEKRAAGRRLRRQKRKQRKQAQKAARIISAPTTEANSEAEASDSEATHQPGPIITAV